MLAEALEGVVSTATDVDRIAVGHGAVDSLSPDPLNPALISVSVLDARSRSIGCPTWRSAIVTPQPRWGGPSGRGSPVGTDYGEINSNKALIVDVKDVSVTVDPVEVGSWRFLIQHFDLAGPESVGQVGVSSE